eukprot:9104426-Alexandrium_andersonii.AAC.1
METWPSLPVTVDRRRPDKEISSGPPGTSEGLKSPSRSLLWKNAHCVPHWHHPLPLLAGRSKESGSG